MGLETRRYGGLEDTMVEWGRMGWALGSLGELWAAAGRGVVQICGSLAYHSTLVQAYHCALALVSDFAMDSKVKL